MLSLNLIKRLFQCKTIIERPDLISKNETLSVPFLASQELMVEWSPLMVHNVLMEIIKEMPPLFATRIREPLLNQGFE